MQNLQNNQLVQANHNETNALQNRDTQTHNANVDHYCGPPTNFIPQDRNIDNALAWIKSSKEDASTKKRWLWITRGVVLSAPSTTTPRAIPLAVDNKLPAIAIRFGSCDGNEVQFLCHVDSYSGMNAGNLLLHQWIIAHHPDIVGSHKEHDDTNPFTSLRLDVAVPTGDADNNLDNQLTTFITYKTRHKTTDGKNALLSFGLGKDIQVNATISLPQIKTWNMLLDLDDNKHIVKLFNMWLPIEYNDAATRMPPTMQFIDEDFKRLPHPSMTG